MILRRVIEHVRTQNWTAIFLDFIIVVLGVFMGIQLGNWNEARALKASERSHLRQLQEEIRVNDLGVAYQIRFANRIIDGGRAGLAFFEGDGECAPDCARLLIDFFHASQVWGTPFVTAAFDEAKRLGFPTDGAVRRAVQEYYRYAAGWEAAVLTTPPFREAVRRHFTPNAAAALWAGCWRASGQAFEELAFDCEDALNAIELGETLKGIYADPALAGDLQYWIGQNALAVGEQGLPLSRLRAAVAIAAIDDALGAGK